MRFLFTLCLSSMKARILTVGLVIFSLSVSGFLLLGVDRIHTSARSNFENTISQTDLIVGARSSAINLLLYSVFRIGNPTNNISWESYQELTKDDSVAWTVPISLGDSFRGFRVVGTNQDYFKYYRYGNKSPLELAEGQWFGKTYQVTLGSAVAKKLNMQLGQKMVVSHGVGEVVFEKHEEHPFKVVGILKPTGTPVDQSVHLSLESITAIHLGWTPDSDPSNLAPTDISAFLLGLKKKREIFQTQRMINEYPEEALSAIIPGMAFIDLWRIVEVFESALTVTGLAVVLSSLLGMLATIITGLSARSREFAILRSVGARPITILSLTLLETLITSVIACLLAFLMLAASLPTIEFLAETYFGFILKVEVLNLSDLKWVALIIGTTIVIGFIPATMAVKMTLSQGLQIKL